MLRIDASETIGALAGGGSLGGGVNLGANSLTLAGTNASTRFSAQISGTGAVVKNGSGTMILTASNNFGGPWQINGGIVRIQDGNALGQGGFSAATWTLVANNAAVEIDGSLSVGEHMHILGRGPDNLGALRSVSGNSSLNQHIALDGNSSVGVSAGVALTQNFQFYNGSGPCTLTKVGAGTLTVNTFVFPNVLVAEGRFVNNGALQGSVVVTNGGTLSGTGVIGGPLSVTSGGTLVPGSSIGVLTVSNAVSLAGTCVLAVQKIGGGTANSQLAGVTSLSYGGALVVTNLGGTLAAGDSFRLFSANSYGGHFASASLPPLVPGLYWDSSQLAVNGTVRVATAPALSVSFSGSWLSLLWPTGYTGWLLEGQTNPVSLGLSTNWTIVPGLTSNGLSVPLGSTNGSAFFRLVLPTP